MGEKKNLAKCTKREMKTLAHYKFTSRAISKSEVTKCEISVSSEFRTTKTCGKCFKMNNNIKESRGFWCDYCGYKTGRDINAARNNVIKYINRSLH